MSKASSASDADLSPEITVSLMGRGQELLREQYGEGASGMDLKVQIPAERGELTPLGIIRAIAEQNPLLRDHIVRADGTPRSSTRILLNGDPPRDLGMKLEVRKIEASSGAGARDDEKSLEVPVIGVYIPGVGYTGIVVVITVPCDG